jgi:predicted nucleic acid-binding protein
MNGFLLDTNVLSELRKGTRCDANMRRWFATIAAEELFISVLVLGEIRKGIERIRPRDPHSAFSLEKWLCSLTVDYADRLLPVDQNVADKWGQLGLTQPIPVIDALLAATALVHDLTMVTRDEDGFRNTGAHVINPFLYATA